MQKNSQDFSIQEALRLAQSDTGQQLFALLQRTDPDTLRQAMDQAAAGDLNQAKNSLQTLMNSEDVKKLLQQLGG